MVHTAVVLPPELVARLKTDAEASDQGLSAEIRQRLLGDRIEYGLLFLVLHLLVFFAVLRLFGAENGGAVPSQYLGQLRAC